MRDVNADPFAIEFLRSSNGCAAAAEWIDNYIALIGRGLEGCALIKPLVFELDSRDVQRLES